MKDWIARTIDRPVVAHAMSANTRYGQRLGAQFAAGVTYFSVLSLIPILMLTFSTLGLTLTVLRPDMLDQLKSYIDEQLGDANDLAAALTSVIDQALSNWQSIGIAALFTAAYSGSKWAGNLKSAVRVMWSETFEDAIEKKNFVIELGVNLLIFLGLITCIGVGLGVSSIGTSFSTQVIAWLGWQDVPGIEPLVRIVAVLGTFVACWLLFAFLFIVMPNEPAAPRTWLFGTLIGALGATVLQSLVGILVRLMSGNVSAAIFGNIIIFMLLFNVLATLILMTASWVGTEKVWRGERADRRAERARALLNSPDPTQFIDVPASTVVAATPIGPTMRFAGRHNADELREPVTRVPEPDPDAYVRQGVARRGMQTNLAVGYGIGTATGLGLGALLISLLSRFSKRS